MIRELRILPPLAIARFGAAATPMDNYDATVDPDRPLGYRHLRPAETFEVDPATGEIARPSCPNRVIFTENGLVRPVAPFLELWALTDDDQLEPLTADLLAEDQAEVAIALAGRSGQSQGLPGGRMTTPTGSPRTAGTSTTTPFTAGRELRTTSGRTSRSRSDRSSSSGRPRRTQRSGCASARSRVRLRREPHPPGRAAGRPERARHRLRRQPRRLAGLRGLRPPADHRAWPDLRAGRAGQQPRIPGRRLRRPGPRLAEGARPDPAGLRPGRRRSPRVRAGRAAGPQRGRRAEQALFGPGVQARRPSRWSRPRRLSGGPSRRFG